MLLISNFLYQENSSGLVHLFLFYVIDRPSARLDCLRLSLPTPLPYCLLNICNYCTQRSKTLVLLDHTESTEVKQAFYPWANHYKIHYFKHRLGAILRVQLFCTFLVSLIFHITEEHDKPVTYRRQEVLVVYRRFV